MSAGGEETPEMACVVFLAISHSEGSFTMLFSWMHLLLLLHHPPPAVEPYGAEPARWMKGRGDSSVAHGDAECFATERTPVLGPAVLSGMEVCVSIA